MGVFPNLGFYLGYIVENKLNFEQFKIINEYKDFKNTFYSKINTIFL